MSSLILLFPLVITLGHFVFSHEYSNVLSVPLLFLLLLLMSAAATVSTLSARSLVAFCAYLVVSLTSCAIGIAMDANFLWSDYVGSFVLCSLLAVVMLYAANVRLPSADLLDRSLQLLARFGAWHAVLLMIQFVLLNAFHSTALLNPFGPFAKYGPYGTYYAPVSWDSLWRPNGLFSEPSAAAWFEGICLAAALARKGSRARFLSIVPITIALGMLATASLSGVVNLLLILAFALVLNSARPIRLRSVVMLAIAAITFLVASIVLSGRADELFQPGRSLYVRFVAPARLALDALLQYPLGVPLGQTTFIENQEYYVRNGALAESSSLDNGFFVIIVYFGLPGIILVAWAVRTLWRLLSAKSWSSVILVALMLAISQSGALWSPTYMVMIAFTMIAVRTMSCRTAIGTPENTLAKERRPLSISAA